MPTITSAIIPIMHNPENNTNLPSTSSACKPVADDNCSMIASTKKKIIQIKSST